MKVFLDSTMGMLLFTHVCTMFTVLVSLLLLALHHTELSASGYCGTSTVIVGHPFVFTCIVLFLLAHLRVFVV